MTREEFIEAKQHVVSSVGLLAAGAVSIGLAAGLVRMHIFPATTATAPSIIQVRVTEARRPQLAAGVKYICHTEAGGAVPALACSPR